MEELQTYKHLATKIVEMHMEVPGYQQWMQEQNPQVQKASTVVLSSGRGCLAIVCPIPCFLGCSPQDVLLVMPSLDTKKAIKRKEARGIRGISTGGIFGVVL